MAHDAALGERVRRALAGTAGLTEHQMFGGLCFLVDGHMCAGIVGNTLMVRIGPDGYREVPATDASLGEWVTRGARFAASLPPKPATT